ncbi:MAG TPA: polysaccharide pyruvyl transferase family protein, partial [Tepidisphaeraceae bacterium]|nr:polysaccharide pyruvyl transferase family protein [Tepidisphaeraceae bacterium]
MSREELRPADRPLRLHIGHHFFGSGNLGDDLMLAGFMAALRTQRRAVELTCASPFDLASQSRRFPNVRWMPYEPSPREDAIRGCDAWVGIGGTPFQVVVGPWFLDHLAADLELCQKHGKPMHFIGIGVNEASALKDSRATHVLSYADRIWTRDERSAELIGDAGFAAKVSSAADLAHVYLKGAPHIPVEAQTIGHVLNFEDPGAFDPAAVQRVTGRLSDRRHRWLVQESRPLEGSELAIFEKLPADVRTRLDLRVPDYSNGSLADLLAPWGSPETLVTSRYHAAVIGAWHGARVVSVERSEKIRGLVAQLGVVAVPDFNDPKILLDAIARAVPVDRRLLDKLARLAEDACHEMIDHIAQAQEPCNRAALASVEAKDSPRFQSFMAMMNAFAGSFGLRRFTSWSKIWEYPWLWHAALSGTDWAGKRVVDLGSEISP